MYVIYTEIELGTYDSREIGRIHQYVFNYNISHGPVFRCAKMVPKLTASLPIYSNAVICTIPSETF